MVVQQELRTGGYGAGKKPGLFFHDAWNEYAVVLPEKIKNSVCHLALDYILHGFI
jgi:hypothetical protein